MPDETTPPAPPPAPPPESTAGLWAIGWKVLGLTAEQQRGMVALVLTFFLMWFVYDSVQEGRRAENERTALVIRAFEGEGEKGRQAVESVGKLTVASHQKLAAELGKLESRLADMAQANARLEQRVGELTAALAGLQKKLPPPPEADICPLPVRFRAPPPPSSP